MKEPILVVMAAGMGSRYGGLKQIDPVGAQGEIIVDYSLFDARQAGFQRVVFIIKEEHLAEFQRILAPAKPFFAQLDFAFQRLEDIPAGYTVPATRTKPWGTGHAVLSCRHLIDAPFAVINADDFYGRHGFQVLYDFLKNLPDAPSTPAQYAMTAYDLGNTVTENGHVARGVCSAAPDGYLAEIHERTHIEQFPEKIAYTEDEGKTWVTLPDDTPVSLNFWGFSPDFMGALQDKFPLFLDKALVENPDKAEFFLPFVVDEQLRDGKAKVKLLSTPEKWYGVTYHADKPVVVEAIAAMTAQGIYPQRLWGAEK